MKRLLTYRNQFGKGMIFSINTDYLYIFAAPFDRLGERRLVDRACRGKSYFDIKFDQIYSDNTKLLAISSNKGAFFAYLSFRSENVSTYFVRSTKMRYCLMDNV